MSDSTTTIDREQFSPLMLAERLAERAYKPNATYPDPPKADEFVDLPAVAEFYFGLASGDPVLFKGPPGTGKSSVVRYCAEMAGVRAVVLNLPNCAPEDLALPLPVRKTGADGVERTVLGFMLYKELMSPEPKVIVLEEMSRASSQVQNMALELIQQRRLADIEIPNLVGIFACDNMTAEDGITKQYDLAMADRWHTVLVDPNATPWRRALADRWPTVDLSGVYQVYATLGPRLRYLLSPRTLEHVIWNLLEGNPGTWGLPIINSQRQLLLDEPDKNGKSIDKTDEIIERIANALKVPNRASVGDPFERVLRLAIEKGVNCYIEGPPGIGKTAHVRQVAGETGCHVFVLSTPVVSPENLVVPFPKDGELELMLMEFLAMPGRKILVLDEVWRCSAQVRNKIMEILQERTLGGVPIEDLVCCIALNNPREVAGYRLEVGKADRAQADRFFMSISISAQDVPWASHLYRTYGDDAETFLEWWKEDIDDAARVVITARTIERMIKRYRAGRPLEAAKVFLNEEYVPVSLNALERRLENRPLVRLKAIAANVDDYEAALSGPEGENHPKQTEVYFAFWNAELEQLEANRDVCVRLMKYLNQQNSINLIRSVQKRQEFWFQVLREARGGVTPGAPAAKPKKR